MLLRTATADPQALHRVKCCRSFELLSSAGFKRTQSKIQGKDKASAGKRDTLKWEDPRHTRRRERGTEAEMKGKQTESSGHQGFVMLCGHSCVHPVVILSVNQHRIRTEPRIHPGHTEEALNSPFQRVEIVLESGQQLGQGWFYRQIVLLVCLFVSAHVE